MIRKKIYNKPEFCVYQVDYPDIICTSGVNDIQLFVGDMGWEDGSDYSDFIQN